MRRLTRAPAGPGPAGAGRARRARRAACGRRRPRWPPLEARRAALRTAAALAPGPGAPARGRKPAPRPRWPAPAPTSTRAGERRRRLATLDAVQPARPLIADLNRLAGEQRQAQAQLAAGEHELARALAAQQEAAARPDRGRAQARSGRGSPARRRRRSWTAPRRSTRPWRRWRPRTRRRARALTRRCAEARAGAARRCRPRPRNWTPAGARCRTPAPGWTRHRALRSAGRRNGRAGTSAWRRPSRPRARMRPARRPLDAAQGRRRAGGRRGPAHGACARRLDRTARHARSSARAQAGEALAAHRRRRPARRTPRAWTRGASGWRRSTRPGRRCAAPRRAWPSSDARRAQATQARARRRGSAGRGARRRHRAGRHRGPGRAPAEGGRSWPAPTASRSCAPRWSTAMPCPVCGGADHPYRHQDDRLHAVLDEPVRRTGRAPPRAARQPEPAGRRSAPPSTPPASGWRSSARERDGLAAALAQLDAEWHDNPLAAEAPDDDAGARGAWLAGQQPACAPPSTRWMRATPALRRAVLARDAAQQAWDQANAEHARLLDGGAGRAGAAGAAGRRHRRAWRPGAKPRPARWPRCWRNSTRCWPSACGDGWQAHWQRDPAGWRERARGRGARMARTRGAPGAAAGRDRHAGGRARGAWRRASSRPAAPGATPRRPNSRASTPTWRARRQERARLFDGRPAREVEQALAAAVAARARRRGTPARRPACRRPSCEARVRAAQAQAARRIADLQGELADAGERLAQWIHDFAGSDPELEPVENEQQLAALLQVGAAWIAQERAALLELDGQRAPGRRRAGRTPRPARAARRPGSAAAAARMAEPDADADGRAATDADARRRGLLRRRAGRAPHAAHETAASAGACASARTTAGASGRAR